MDDGRVSDILHWQLMREGMQRKAGGTRAHVVESGPLHLVLQGLPSGITLDNQAGMHAKPSLSIPSAGVRMKRCPAPYSGIMTLEYRICPNHLRLLCHLSTPIGGCKYTF